MIFAHLSLHSYRFKREKKSVLCLTHNVVVSAQKIVDFKHQGPVTTGDRDFEKDSTWV